MLVANGVEPLLAHGARVCPLRPRHHAREAVRVGARLRVSSARETLQHETPVFHRAHADSCVRNDTFKKVRAYKIRGLRNAFRRLIVRDVDNS